MAYPFQPGQSISGIKPLRDHESDQVGKGEHEERVIPEGSFDVQV